MPSTSETGHAKIPANLFKLITVAKRYPAKYKPANAKLGITAVETLVTTCESAVDGVGEPEKIFKNTRSNRQQLFEPVGDTATAAYNSLLSLDKVDASILKAAAAALKKIKGTTGTKAAATDGTTAETPKKHSTSQQSFDMRIKNFKDFITSLKQVAAYTPEESNITIASLEAYASSLTDANKAVDTAYNDYSKALQLRDTLLYHPETGVVQLSKKLKSYLKSVKDISASDKQEAAAIPFKAPAKKDLFL